MKRISTEVKTNIINQLHNGVSVASLVDTTGVSRSTVYRLRNEVKNDLSEKPLNKATVDGLKRTVARLTNLVEILQRIFEVDQIPTQTRLEELEKLYGEYNVHNLCEAL